MGKLTDVAIRAWIRSGERFEGRSDGDGLVLTWREKRTAPSWRLRYRFSGKPRVMEIGSYSDLTLAAARQAAKELRAKIALGHDVAGEKQERKSMALARIEAARSVTTVGQLADEYFERMINGRWKHPNIVRNRIEKDIKPHLSVRSRECHRRCPARRRRAREHQAHSPGAGCLCPGPARHAERGTSAAAPG